MSVPDDMLPPVELRDAVDALRAEVPVRAEWRDALLRRAALTEPVPAPRAFHAGALTVRPLTAIAACLLCMAAGAATMRVVASRAPRSSRVDAVAEAPDAARVVRFVLVAPGAARVSVV